MTSLLKEIYDSNPERPPADALERALRPDGRLEYSDSRDILLRSLPGLKALRLSDGATVSVARILTIPEHGQRVVSFNINPDVLPERLWVEWEEMLDQGPWKTGWLIERLANDRIRGLRFQGNARMNEAAFFPVILRKATDGWVFDHERPLSARNAASSAEMLDTLRAALVILSAKDMLQVIPNNKRERGVPPLGIVRLAEPWREVTRDGVPVSLQRAAPDSSVLDLLSDYVFTSAGMMRLGGQWHHTAEIREITGSVAKSEVG